MTMSDMKELDNAYEKAIRTMGDCAVVIAEEVMEGRTPTEQMIKNYHISRLGVQSTRRDLVYCLSLEIAKIESTT